MFPWTFSRGLASRNIPWQQFSCEVPFGKIAAAVAVVCTQPHYLTEQVVLKSPSVVQVTDTVRFAIIFLVPRKKLT
jgi:hypothetical protein